MTLFEESHGKQKKIPPDFVQLQVYLKHRRKLSQTGRFFAQPTRCNQVLEISMGGHIGRYEAATYVARSRFPIVASEKATLTQVIVCIRKWTCIVAKHHHCASRP